MNDNWVWSLEPGGLHELLCDVIDDHDDRVRVMERVSKHQVGLVSCLLHMRNVIEHSPPGVITDTLWVSETETAVDRINNTLGARGKARLDR